MNAEKILGELHDIRKVIPQVTQRRTETHVDGRSAGGEADAVAEFEYAAVEDALQSMANDLAAAIGEAHARLLADCLEVYYATEELARDPAHADLTPRVEEMRRAYLESYGRPIPPRRTMP